MDHYHVRASPELLIVKVDAIDESFGHLVLCLFHVTEGLELFYDFYVYIRVHCHRRALHVRVPSRRPMPNRVSLDI
jgi:hypothetical protein